MSYFAENEPMAKVEKRTQIVTRLLPISSELKESAGLVALDKAAHKYLSNGLITDSEQAHLDDFSTALGLPVNNLPAKYKGSDIERCNRPLFSEEFRVDSSLHKTTLRFPSCWLRANTSSGNTPT